MKHQRKGEKNKKRTRLNLPKVKERGFLRCSVIGAISSIGIALILGVIASLILFKTKDPLKLIVPSALSVLYISTLLGGYIASRINKCSAMLTGLLSSLFVLLFLLFISLFIPASHSSGYGILSSISLRLALVVSSLVGAFIGISNKKSAKKRKKR